MTMTTPSGQPTPLQPGEFASASRPSEITFHLKDLPAPSALYVRAEEQLQFNIWNSSPLITSATISFRMLLPDGRLQVGNIDKQLTSDRANNQLFIPLTEGYLLNIFVQITQNGAVQRGQTFVQALLVRGGLPGQVNYYLFFEGYFGQRQGLSWPGGPMLNMADGPGWIHSVQQANPLAGQDWVYTIPATSRQRIQSLSAILTTAVAAGNRNVELIVDDGVNIVWRASAAASVAPSTVQTFSATGTNLPAGVITTTSTILLPPTLVLNVGHRIRTSTTNIQAADQWSAIWVFVEETLSTLA